MSSSFSFLRRVLYAAGVAGSLTFGVAQAFAGAGPGDIRPYCPARGYPYGHDLCNFNCPEGGYCSATGRCECGSGPYWPEY